MFAALSDRLPDVVSKVSKFIAFGPVTYVEHVQFKPLPEPFLRLANVTDLVEIYNTVKFLGYGAAANKTYEYFVNHTLYEILPFTNELKTLGK